MSSKTLCLHIGTNKTGTTTIQRFMAMNRAALLQQGVFYPLKNATSGGNHSMLARDLQRYSEGKIPRAAVWEEFLQAARASDAGKVVVSGEVFWSFNGDMPYFRRLKDDLLEHFSKVRVIVYLRRQDEYLRSCYAQAVKSGRSPRSFQEYTETIALGKKRRAYDYKASLDPWAEAFGEGNLCVRPFEKEQLHPAGLVADFCHSCDIHFPGLDADKAKDVNISPGRRVMAAMLYAQELLPPMRGTGPRARRQTALCSAMATRLAKDWQGKDLPFKGFRAGEAQAFYAQFREGNAAIAKRFLGRPDGDLFGKRAFVELLPTESDEVILDEAEREQVRDQVHALIGQLPPEGP